jgi:hypothetical protein
VTNSNNKPKFNPYITNQERFDQQEYKDNDANIINPNLNEVIDVKLSVLETTDLFITSTSINTNLNYRTGYFTVQVFQNSTQAFNDPYSIQNGLALMDSRACEKKIKEFYGFSSEVTIPVGKINWDPTLSDADNIGDVSFIFYHPYTGQKINQAEICKDIGIQVKLPVNTTGINMTEYENFKNKSIDILDPNGEFFNSRCFPYVNETSDADVTINDRRKNIYTETSVSCSIGCTYKGIDKNNYTICDCKETNTTQAAVTTVPLPGLENSNIEIFICFDSAFTSVNNNIF